MRPEISRIFDLIKLYETVYAGRDVVFTFMHRNRWKSFSAADYVNYSRWVSAGLLAHGISKGDNIATIVCNCPAWNCIDMGIMQVGAVQVPIYPTLSTANFRHIFHHAEIKGVFISDISIYERIKDILAELPGLKFIYSVDKPGNTEIVRHWGELLRLGKETFDENQIHTRRAMVSPNDLATIIYTSGTTGIPKGVMLSHSNFISNFLATAAIVEPQQVRSALSFLPLCHVYERMLNYMYQYLGIKVIYARRLDTVMEDLQLHKPDMVCAVPKVLEKMYDGFAGKVHSLRWPMRCIYHRAFKLAGRFRLGRNKYSGYELRRGIADFLVFRHWRAALGGKLRYIVSGGASLRPKIARVFWAAKIQVMEGYGLTETSPVVAVSNFEPGGVKFGTVGPPLKGVQVKIAEDGEILVRGPNLMMGYYKDPELTAQVIDKEGWFHTGDIGTLVDGKYLKITDRKKEIFKTSGGRYIAPQVIENRFKESPFIENIMVVGENRSYATALIVPNFKHVEGWFASKGLEYKSPQHAVKDKRLIERIQREVDQMNQMLDRTEQIRCFYLLDHEWKIESGELSPTLKLRRHFLQQKYRRQIDAMYR